MVDGPIRPGQTVLVTGPTGFVGRRVCSALEAAGYSVRPGGRHEVGEIHRGTDWRDVLDGCAAVVHLAARVHVMTRDPAEGEEAFREVNLHGTAALVQQAAAAGVRRFVFVSTAKVLGESGTDLTPDAPLAPHDAYAVSKAEAEAAVRELSGPGMETAILRPPLVYGPGVRANFERLMGLAARGWPLPLGAVDNQRSLIAVDNLADAVRHALTCRHGIYHPRDAENWSTRDLIRQLAAAMHRPCRLFPVPPGILRAAGRLTGTYPAVDRLTGTFTINGAMDGWTPPFDSTDALQDTVDAFLKRRR